MKKHKHKWKFGQLNKAVSVDRYDVVIIVCEDCGRCEERLVEEEWE